jgi:hypothetical protein
MSIEPGESIESDISQGKGDNNMADKNQTAPNGITKADIRKKDLKRVNLIKVKKDFRTNPDVLSAALDAFERELRQKKAVAA